MGGALPTTSIEVQRQMLAVLAADVVGYSGLMEADEAATIDYLRSARGEVIDPLIVEHKGRIISVAGDGLIATFGSVVDAVRAAVAIQSALKGRVAIGQRPKNPLLRIGINLGDIAQVDGQLYGDGINVAARLEQLCEPGSVTISGTVFDHLQGKLDLPFRFDGEQRVKNILRPVRVYRLGPNNGAKPFKRPKLGRSYLSAFAATAIALVVAMGWIWWSEKGDGTARPAIAVLPFDNFGGDEASARLANGITEDIITDLASFRDMDVIARNSTMAYQGKHTDIRTIGHDLGVNYVLEGSIQRSGDRIRATAQLIDAEDGSHVWANRWDRPLGDVFEIQSEISENVASALGGSFSLASITTSEIDKVRRKRPSDLDAFEHYLLALDLKKQATAEGLEQARQELDRAIALDPTLARAYAARGWVDYFSMMFGVDPAKALASMEQDTRQAVKLDPRDAEARITRAQFEILDRDFTSAASSIDDALKLGPANVQVLAVGSALLPLVGEPDRGVEMARKALRLDPRMPELLLLAVKDGLFFADDWTGTIDTVERVEPAGRTRDAWLFLGAAYAASNASDKAIKTKDSLLANFPTVSAEAMLNQDYAFKRQEEQDKLVTAFRRLELPICMKPDEISGYQRPHRLGECQPHANN